MKTFFRSILVAALAVPSLVAVADSAERAATVDRPDPAASHRMTAVAVAAMGKARTGLTPSNDCDADHAASSPSGALREQRVARMDFENAKSADPESENQDGIIPAIYTWKPETRFVFYRNVGKWM